MCPGEYIENKKSFEPWVDCEVCGDAFQQQRCEKCWLDRCLQMGMVPEAVEWEMALEMEDSSTEYPAVIPDGESREKEIQDLRSAVSAEQVGFPLDPSSLPDPTISKEYMFEFSTTLLSRLVDWVLGLPAFRNLSRHDQLALLQHSWSAVFLLGVAQCSDTIPLSSLLTFARAHLDTPERGDLNLPLVCGQSKAEKIMQIEHWVSGVKEEEVDSIEFAYFRLLLIFTVGCPSIEHLARVNSLQDSALFCLETYTKERHLADQPIRFAKLLVRLMSARAHQKPLVEEVFFASMNVKAWIAEIMENAYNKQ